jgi:hypothetical protein
MNKIVLILILIIIISFFVYDSEHFTNKCEFMPRGMNINHCKQTCMRGKSYGWNSGSNCDSKTCGVICAKCDNSNRCRWLDNYSSNSGNNDIHISTKKPQTILLKKSSDSDDRNIVLKWKELESTTNTGYIIHVYENVILRKKLRIIYTNKKEIIFEIKKTNLEEELSIKKENYLLNKNSNHIIYVYGMDRYGINNVSNEFVIEA